MPTRHVVVTYKLSFFIIYIYFFSIFFAFLLYFLLRELVQYRKDNKRLDYDDVALVACVMFIG